MTHTLRPVLAAALLTVCVGSASGNLFFYDSFNYPSASGMNLSAAAPANWSHSGGTIEPLVQNVGGLTYPNLQTSSDTFSVQYDGTTSTGSPGHEISSGITTGSVYYSLLMKVTDVGTTSGFGTGGNLTTGSFMAGLETLAPTSAPTVGASAAPLLIRSGDGTQFATTYQLGTSKTATAADRQFYTGQAFNVNDTVFVVLKYAFDSVNGDSAGLFINPTPGSAEPAAQLNVSAGTNLILGTPAGIKSFFVRNNSVEPDALLIDELRIGDTWHDVTPMAGDGIPGDFNNDGRVDAGDYATWRKNNGTNNALANDNGLGTPVGAAHYNLWRAHFGKPPGAGSGLGGPAVVPEPTTLGLAFVGLAIFGVGRRKG